jgi:hypothetical protein
MLKGMLATKIAVVAVLPQSGDPDVSSKTQPTPAIAAIQEIPRNKLLFGVIISLISTVIDSLEYKILIFIRLNFLSG